MSKISTVSKYVRILLVTIASLQLMSHFLLVFFSEYKMGLNQLTIDFTLFSSKISHQTNNSWQEVSQALEAEGFNSLVILGSMQLIPYLLIYLFLFKLFTLYQHGQVFTLANSNCFKNIALSLLAWIPINLLYPIVVTLFIRLTGLSESMAIHISLGSREFIYLLSGLIIYVMAWIMSDASKLHQEQELVI